MSEIETGVETDTELTRTSKVDAVGYAVDDDGFGTRWRFVRVDDEIIEQHVDRLGPNGEVDSVTPDGTAARARPEVLDVDAETSTSEFAREVVDADPELAVEAAREHFEEDVKCPFCGSANTEYVFDLDGLPSADEQGKPIYECNACVSKFPLEEGE